MSTRTTPLIFSAQAWFPGYGSTFRVCWSWFLLQGFSAQGLVFGVEEPSVWGGGVAFGFWGLGFRVKALTGRLSKAPVAISLLLGTHCAR